MSESSSSEKQIIATRTYEIDGKTYIVKASQSKYATEDAATKIRRLIRKEILNAIEQERQEQQEN